MQQINHHQSNRECHLPQQGKYAFPLQWVKRETVKFYIPVFQSWQDYPEMFYFPHEWTLHLKIKNKKMHVPLGTGRESGLILTKILSHGEESQDTSCQVKCISWNSFGAAWQESHWKEKGKVVVGEFQDKSGLRFKDTQTGSSNLCRDFCSPFHICLPLYLAFILLSSYSLTFSPEART